MSSSPANRRILNRREFLQFTGAAAGAAVLSTCGRDTSVIAPNLARGGPAPITRYPLHIPQVVSPSGLTLDARPATVNLGDGRSASVWAYNGGFPGPTIRASAGSNATINFVNGLPEPSITHWHGMIVDDANDGHPRFAVPAGSSYQYQFAVDQRACLNWYHPHPHMLTGKQVGLGLAGAFIVTDAAEAALNLPSGSYEVPLIIRDTTLDRNGSLQYKPSSGGFLGQTPLVNGTRDPRLAVDTALYRFRILNGSNARIYGLALSTGGAMTLIGNDGGLLQAPTQVTRLDIAPAERLDVLIDFRQLPVGTRLMLRDLRAGWDLLEFEVTNQVSVPGSIPAVLSSITPLTNPVTTRAFSFDGMSRINGKEYDMNRIDFTVPFGQVERWRFRTAGNAPHPVHVHGTPFQVISRSGGRGQLFPWEHGWKDTVLLEDGETVEILIRFDRFRTEYLLHCHKLEHEDMGMMSNFLVV